MGEITLNLGFCLNFNDQLRALHWRFVRSKERIRTRFTSSVCTCSLIFLACLPANADSDDSYDKGMSLLRARNPKESIPFFDIAIKQCDTKSKYYLRRGEAYKLTCQFDKAEADLLKALKLRPGLIEAHFYLGEVYHNSGRLDDAIKEFSIAIAAEPDHGEWVHMRGQTFSDAKKFPEAIKDFSKAIELQPGKDRYYKDRALSYYRLKQYEKAILDYDACIRLKPDLPTSWLARGECHRELKQYSKALQDYTDCLRVRPGEVRAFVGRAKIYELMGRKDLADKDLKKATEQAEDFTL